MNFQNEMFSDSKNGGRSRLGIAVFGLMILVGVAGFLSGITGSHPQRTWQAYLINYVFWTGLAFGAVLFVAVLNMTNARWGRPLKRLAEAPGAFLPISFLLFWLLYLGRKQIFPWIEHPVEEKAFWLDIELLFARDGIGLLVLTGVATAMLYFSLRGDVEASRTGDCIQIGRENGHWRVQRFLSPILAILYALILSLVAIDLIMSLDPHWYSTLFGAYYFVGSFYTALAALVIIAGFYRHEPALKSWIEPRHFHDLGKLLLGFCLLTGDFFYSQFLIIWYGNLPEDSKYVILRVRHTPWEPLAWMVLIVCFGLPFLVLLSRRIKMRPKSLMILSGVILIGMWLERLVLIAPSIWRGQQIPIGLPELLITAGFFGVMGGSVMLFLRTFPLLPVSDPLLGIRSENPRH